MSAQIQPRLLVFDLWGTLLSRPRPAGAAGEIANRLGTTPEALTLVYRSYETLADVGVISQFEFWARVAHDLGSPRPITAAEAQEFTELALVSCQPLPMLAEVARLAQCEPPHRLMLVTNTRASHLEFTRTHFPGLAKLFPPEVVWASCETGLTKPSPQVYRAVRDLAQVTASIRLAPLVIDDDWRNIRAARWVGLETLHVPTPATAVDALRAILQD